MTMNNVFNKLRQGNKGQYRLLGFCIFLSVLLISSFSFMYFGPTVQEFLPEGGDTRKMATLLLAATATGCSIFTIYASTLFFRYKSREYGIFLALGEPKRALKKVLLGEVAQLTVQASALGILLGLPASWFIWKLFETFLVSTEEMTYRLGFTGLYVSIGFTFLLTLLLFLTGRRFVNKSDIMDILKTEHKTEMVKEIKSWCFPVGILLVFLGLILGLGLNTFSVRVFHQSIPGTSLFYLFALVGIYLILLSVVSQNRLGKKKEKFYKNMVSISLMRFSAKSTTRNMCVIVLLLFSCMFSAFYGMLYANTEGLRNLENSNAFAMHYPLEEKQITKEDILATAAEYDMDIVNFCEEDATNLVISYKTRDYDDGKYITVDAKQAKLALFFSASTYEALTGRTVDVTSGSYKTITPTDYKENIWYFMDGLYEMTNPDTGKSTALSYSGSVEYDALYSMSDPYAYVISDTDYDSMVQGVSDKYKEHIVLFDVADYTKSYSFAKDLLAQYTTCASALSDHMGNYDFWEEKLALKQGVDYSYTGSIDLDIANTRLLSDWKYAPQLVIITLQEFMQMISVYVMLCLYIFIITLTAVAIMNYVRSISIAENNKGLFVSLTKLGANTEYQKMILKKQLAKIFQYPGLLGCLLGFFFSLGMSWINDERITTSEYQTLAIMFAISALILLFLYTVYRIAKKKAENIVGI